MSSKASSAKSSGFKSSHPDAEGRAVMKSADFEAPARVHCIIPGELRERARQGCFKERVNLTDVIIELLERRFPKT